MLSIGISVHTGWGACVVVSGSLREPEIVSNKVIKLLDDEERFCYHRAAEMQPELVQEWLMRLRIKVLERARTELSSLLPNVGVGAIVARQGAPPDLHAILASHSRIHSAEGLFYRDIFREACRLPCRIISPDSLSVAAAGKVAARPWARDQKRAALAAWQVLGE